jgi:quinol monooxygenase YgiN
MSVTVIVSFQAKPDKIDALLEFLANVQPNAIKAGCRSISLLQDQTEKHRIYEIEEWESAEEHQKMVKQAEESGAFGPVADLTEGPPENHYLDTIRSSQA